MDDRHKDVVGNPGGRRCPSIHVILVESARILDSAIVGKENLGFQIKDMAGYSIA